MVELLSISIGIGLAISLAFAEIFGVAVGGMVVPGYVALHLTKPLDVIITLGIGFLTFLVVHTLSSVMIVYGRRRTVLMILVGYILVMGMRFLASSLNLLDGFEPMVIGFIIPGLIAIWMDRQGVIETLSALMIASVAVRLILILTMGTELAL